MSTPDEAVQQQLAAQAADLGGAGPSAPAIDLGAAKAAAVDTDALLAQLVAQGEALKKIQAQMAEAEAAANPAPAPPDNTIRGDSNAPAWLHDALGKVETRLAAVEAKLGV